MGLLHVDTIGQLLYWAYVSWEGYGRVECVRVSLVFDDAWLSHLFSKCCKDNEGWKGHRS